MKKILIIDDYPDNVFLLQSRLENEGFEVIKAYQGETGIQKAVEEICTEKFCPSWTFEQYCLPLYCKKFLIEAESRGYKVRP